LLQISTEFCQITYRKLSFININDAKVLHDNRNEKYEFEHNLK